MKTNEIQIIVAALVPPTQRGRQVFVLPKARKISYNNNNQPYMNLERQFSKEFAADERKKTADELRESRRKLKTDWQAWSDEEIANASPEVQEKRRELKRDFLGRLFETKKFLEKKVLFSDLVKAERSRDSRAIMEKYQKRLDEILAQTPLTPEEQDKYLTEEAASGMDVEDYLTLMNRLSGYYVSHVTRYGVREQSFMSTGGGHTVGMGKFMDNFTPVLEAGRLNSFFTNILNETEYTRGILGDLIKRKIEESGAENPDKAVIVEQVLQELMHWDAHDMHPADRTSVHFASNDMAGRYYGSEVGYDVYFYYPAEVIAKNYRHEWQQHTNVKAEHDDWYNDVGIWNEGKGVPLDVGIVCIPENVKVDKKLVRNIY